MAHSKKNKITSKQHVSAAGLHPAKELGHQTGQCVWLIQLQSEYSAFLKQITVVLLLTSA